MPPRTLILGGTGFIGLQLAKALIARAPQMELVLVDNFFRGKLDEEVNSFLSQFPHVQLIEMDLTDPSSFSKITGSFEHVYLLASIVGVRYTREMPELVLETNTKILMNCIHWMATSGAKKLYYAGTSEVYAGGVALGMVPIPSPETVPLVISEIASPRFSYAISKLWGEAYAIAMARKHGFQVVIGRYHNVYGPRMGFEHVIPQILMRIFQKENPLKVYGIDQTRSFCYVSDAVNASIELMFSAQVSSGEIFHIGVEEEVTVQRLVEIILEVADYRVPMLPLPAPAGSVSRRSPSTKKLRERVGFVPQISLTEGVRRTCAWYRAYHEQAQVVK